ncbi:hypothetical protein [Nocardioides sp. B-3]|uniref:hypothetical protein n=1 Tax=Nocardioides sp. B-3 TaxID=2895565 RepID=UPI00215377BA|nr:hypothetical protein [Nocardioides sp. B-3]UUZ61502.1 hypothetical protein LP418_13630 [Nocardioides sp. B-3]
MRFLRFLFIAFASLVALVVAIYPVVNVVGVLAAHAERDALSDQITQRLDEELTASQQRPTRSPSEQVSSRPTAGQPSTARSRPPRAAGWCRTTARSAPRSR